jgi:acetylornithine deacetylase/succinyl-diaminopimelate desuccinylase-like protein
MKRITWLALCLSPTLHAQTSADINAVTRAVDTYRRASEQAIVEDFIELLSLPNVADDLTDMRRNAEHISAELEARGFATRQLTAGGAPYIYGELSSPGSSETVMIYAHYDGQPVNPGDWTHPPFSPTLLDARLETGGRAIELGEANGALDPEWRLYARSAGDDKLPIVALLHALDALAENAIPLSVNLKVLLDGEEEQGSPTVGAVLDEHASLLRADLMLFCDGPMHQSRRAQLIFGVRGDITVDVTAYGATRPLHSGHYGNWAPNPIMQLAHLLTSLRDVSGRILIDGYYDDVAPLSTSERAAIAAMPDITQALRDELAVHTPEGEGLRLEELIALPAINARGFSAGDVGAEGSNIIRPTATVSLDLRLVPEQTPASVRERLESHIADQGFHIVHEEPSAAILRAHPKVARLEWDSGYAAWRTRLDTPAAQRLIGLMRDVSPEIILTPTMGGSLPLHEFGSRLSAPIVILPLANHDNNQHAENENVRLQNLWDAIAVFGAVLASYGRR